MQQHYGRNFVFALIIIVTSYPTLSEISEKDVIEVEMDTMELILLRGYPAEKHVINTKDGYQLTIYRIPHRKTMPASDKPPVLLMHGLFQSSVGWVDNSGDSLGFILANEHYDVWLGNIRGNECTQHSLYTKEEDKFWDYTFDDVAEYDAPAIIDYIREITKQKKILYIGYSLGSTIGFALFSSKPEFIDKVAGFVALAPVASARYSTGFLMDILVTKIQPVLTSLQTFRFNPKALQIIASMMIAYPSFGNFIVTNTAGPSTYRYFHSMSRWPVFIHHTSESTTVKYLRHIIQFEKGYLEKFDYGKKINIDKYGRITPPVYNLNNIVIPVALFSAANDVMASPFDVEMTRRKLKTILADEIVPYANHFNLAYSHPSRPLMYDKILATLENMWDMNGVCQSCGYDNIFRKASFITRGII